MLHPQELRIGNYINQHNEPMRVYYIEHRFKETYVLNDVKVDTRIIADIFTPIPLTPDWLKRLGFVKNGKQFQVKFNMNKVSIITEIIDGKKEFGFVYNTAGYVKLEYVHQLMNLTFALTGKELTL